MIVTTNKDISIDLGKIPSIVDVVKSANVKPVVSPINKGIVTNKTPLIISASQPSIKVNASDVLRKSDIQHLQPNVTTTPIVIKELPKATTNDVIRKTEQPIPMIAETPTAKVVVPVKAIEPITNTAEIKPVEVSVQPLVNILKSEQASDVIRSAAPSVEIPQEYENNVVDMSVNTEKKSNKGLLIAVVAGVALLGIIAASSNSKAQSKSVKGLGCACSSSAAKKDLPTATNTLSGVKKGKSKKAKTISVTI